MVGLHCCGDLTPAILKLFANQVHPSLSSLVVVGCCYHKMSREDPHLELGTCIIREVCYGYEEHG